MLADAAGVLAWRDELGALTARLGRLFVRPEPRRQAGLYLEGLLTARFESHGAGRRLRFGWTRRWSIRRIMARVTIASETSGSSS